MLRGRSVVVRGAQRARLAVLDVSSAGPSVGRQGNGGNDVTDATPTKQRTAAAERMHLARERRRSRLPPLGPAGKQTNQLGRRTVAHASWCAKAHHPRLTVPISRKTWMAGLRPP